METMLTIGYIILFLAWFWLYLTRPEKEKINITVIEMLVTYYRSFSDSEKISLVSQLIDGIEKIEHWQKKEIQ